MTTPLELAAAVRRAIEGANADLERMPFFVRPFVRGGLAKRTGLGAEAWLAKLAGIRADDTPATVAMRWPDVRVVLPRLADNFRSAPERAAKAMSDREVLRQLGEQARMRSAAVDALMAWLTA